MYLQIISLMLIAYLQSTKADIYAIKVNSAFYFEEFPDEPAKFGPSISGTFRGRLINANGSCACNQSSLNPPPKDENTFKNWIVLVPRCKDQNCTFEKNVRVAQSKGYNGVIVYNVGSNDTVPMSAVNSSGINIPSVFVGEYSGKMLGRKYATSDYFIIITAQSPFNITTHLLIPFAIVVGICFLVMIVFMVAKYIKDRRRQMKYRLPTSQLNKIPTCKYKKGDRYETCAICLDDYIEGENLRVLPCSHVYHTKCIDPWLTKNKRVCPVCKRKVFANIEETSDSDSDSDSDDTTPLIRPGNLGTQGGTFEVQNENPIQRAARSASQQSSVECFATASVHHSINGDRVSQSSSSSSEYAYRQNLQNAYIAAEEFNYLNDDIYEHHADDQNDGDIYA